MDDKELNEITLSIILDTDTLVGALKSLAFNMQKRSNARQEFYEMVDAFMPLAWNDVEALRYHLEKNDESEPNTKAKP